MKDLDLLDMAVEAREKAYAPYSGFMVGAALLDRDGQVFTGCNVENVSFGLTLCAERTAIVKAVSAGKRDFEKMMIVAREPVVPCGACLQVMAEFSPEIEIVCAVTSGEMQAFKLADLFPKSFTWSGRTK
ncbi:MAG: cytidine deaminase [Ignavibacteriales bacterium]